MKCLLYKLHVRMVYLVGNWHKTCEWMAHATNVVKNDGNNIQNFWNRIFCNLISSRVIFLPTCLYVSTFICFMCTSSVPVMKLRDFFSQNIELPSVKGTSQNLLTSLQLYFLSLTKQEAENLMEITKYNTDTNKIIFTLTWITL